MKNFCKTANAIRIEAKITIVQRLFGINGFTVAYLSETFLCANQLFTSIVLLSSSSNPGSIAETAIKFLFFFKYIHKSIEYLAIWLVVCCVLRLLVPTRSIICRGFLFRTVGLTRSCVQLTFAVKNGPTLTILLYLIFFIEDNHLIFSQYYLPLYICLIFFSFSGVMIR